MFICKQNVVNTIAPTKDEREREKKAAHNRFSNEKLTHVKAIQSKRVGYKIEHFSILDSRVSLLLIQYIQVSYRNGQNKSHEKYTKAEKKTVENNKYYETEKNSSCVAQTHTTIQCIEFDFEMDTKINWRLVMEKKKKTRIFHATCCGLILTMRLCILSP